MRFWVKESPKNKRPMKLIDELPERVEAIIKTFPQLVAMDVLKRIQSAAPQDIEGYPDMLRVRDLPSIQGWELTAILPPGWANSQRLRSVDVKRTVLYVRPKVKGGVVVEPATVVLERENPWTMDTLPYEPSRYEASMLSRRVTEKEARQIEMLRRENLRAVRIELKALGVQLRPPAKVLLSRRVTRDIAFEVLRYEFGIPPVPGRAHWKPAIRAVPNTVAKQALKSLEDWLAKPSDLGYRSAEDLPYEKASVAKRIRRFQDLVGAGL
jgi:hypothetical protein